MPDSSRRGHATARPRAGTPDRQQARAPGPGNLVPGDQPIKILFFIGRMVGGGAERFLVTVLRRLDRARFKAVLVMIEDVREYELPDDVPVVVLGRARPWHLPFSTIRLARAIDRERPDLVFSTIGLYNLIAGAAVRLSRHRPPWIARLAGNPEMESWGHVPDKLLALAYRWADLVLVNSAGVASAFRRTFSAAHGALCVIHNPTDFEELDRRAAEPAPIPLPPGPIVIGVASLRQAKRPDLLLEAFAAVAPRSSAHLLILGQGPLRATLEGRIAELGLRDRVTLAGFCANPYSVMARADIFVLSSDHEGLPNALIEAQGLGLPAVATDCPHGPREIVEHDCTGYLVPVGDADALAGRIAELLRDPARRRAMGRAARSRARKQFCWEECGRALEERLVGLVRVHR